MLGAKLFARKPGKMLCMKTVGEIVRAWREARGLNARELAEKVGGKTVRQDIENLESRAEIKLIPIWLPRLSRLMGYTTVEELLALKEPPAEEGPTFLGADFVLREPEAQLLSQLRFRLPTKPMSWGDLKMKNELDDVFEVLLEDDAMAPDFPAGTVIKFRKGDNAKFGDRVLLRDRTGEFHFREFAQNFDGEPFEGLATGRGFRSILPRQHGATVVAIKAGHYVEGS